MRPAVRAAFVAFNAPLEGVCSHAYLDVLGLCTTAIGVLVDSRSAMAALPWLRADGTRADRYEIEGEFDRIKARQDWRLRGGAIFKSIALLHLDEAGILSAVGGKLDEMDRQLADRFHGYEAWGSDAQLGALSMSWACGPHFRFPRLEMALRSRDFLLAAEECTISTVGNPGVKPRNERNRVLFRNASVVERDGMDPAPLYWPRDLMHAPVDTEAPTLPEMPANDFAIVHPPVDFPTKRYLDDDDEPDSVA